MLLGVTIIRSIVFWGLHGSPPLFRESTHIFIARGFEDPVLKIWAPAFNNEPQPASISCSMFLAISLSIFDLLERLHYLTSAAGKPQVIAPARTATPRRSKFFGVVELIPCNL